jgi:hypothetical protein
MLEDGDGINAIRKEYGAPAKLIQENIRLRELNETLQLENTEYAKRYSEHEERRAQLEILLLEIEKMIENAFRVPNL